MICQLFHQRFFKKCEMTIQPIKIQLLKFNYKITKEFIFERMTRISRKIEWSSGVFHIRFIRPRVMAAII